ncbi:MAG: hypothetical protein H7Z37_13185 [Pyrinomonadaceae bacterium]|nr:hypothetical protein [Pyrinomonadaceae bacterium]
MSPDDLYKAYKNLSAVAILPDATGADFRNLESRRYVINTIDSKTGMPAEGSYSFDIYSAIDGVLYAGKAYLANPKVKGLKYFMINQAAFARVKVGKGSPEEMEHILEVGLACGHIKPVLKNVADFVDNYFGVDCTGFACAYFRTVGKMLDSSGNDKENPVNIGCGYFFDKAKTLNQIIWNLAEIRQGDVIVWMKEDRSETRKPGHISLIQSIGENGTLYCRESNGSAAEGGKDPRMTERRLIGVEGDESKKNRYWKLEKNNSEQILILRPFV